MGKRRTPEEMLAAERAKIQKEAARAARDHAARLERVARLEVQAEKKRNRDAQRAARDADRAARRLLRTQSEERKKDTRKKIVIGALVLSVSAAHPGYLKWFTQFFDAHTTDPADRELLGLPPLP